ncbi:MAG: hypothetical protein H3Z52_09370 [archaeon]|nr:hypothetical protein [archaeon]MCP8321132.1 hypothetical protein [archaeon]
MSKLSEAHINEIKKWLDGFCEYLRSAEGAEDYKDRRERCERYRDALPLGKIDGLSEVDFERLIGDLYANEFWYDKSQPLKRIISMNPSLDYVKAELKKLLWDNKPISERYDEFRSKVNGLGPSAITELLTLVHSDECVIWSRRVREGIKALKMVDIIPAGKYQINGDEYVKVIDILKEVKDVVQCDDTKLKDLMDVDQFIDYVYKNASKVVPPVILSEDYDFNHDEVKDIIYELGIGLGFEAETEVSIAKGARVDCIWKAKIGNLGIVKYVFEVHGKGGSMDSLILNLQKAKGDPAVQRLIAISNTKNLAMLKEEISSLPEEFKRSLALMEAKDALMASEHFKAFKEILDKLELVKASP